MNPEISSWKNPVSLYGSNNNNALNHNVKDPWLSSQFNQANKNVTTVDNISLHNKLPENDQFLNGIVSQISKISITASNENNSSIASSPWNTPSLINNPSTIWNSSNSSASLNGLNGVNPTPATDQWSLKSGWGTSISTSTSNANDNSIKDLWSPMTSVRGAVNSQSNLYDNDKLDSQSVHSANSGAVTPTPKSTGQASDTASVLSDKSKLSNEDYIAKVVNTPQNWGKIPVDQSTPWNCEDIKGKTNDFSKKFQNQVDPNVWISEPPTGTRIWEAYYESIGKKTGSWKGAQPEICNTPTPSTVWPNKNELSGMQSPIQSNSSIFGNDGAWFDSSNNSEWSLRNKSDISLSTDDVINNGNVRMNPNWNSSMMKKPEPYDKMLPASAKIMTNQNGRSGSNNRVMQMRIHAIKHLTDMGFKKEDAQHALITNNMDIERALADLSGTKSRPLFPPNSIGGGVGGGGAMNRMPSNNSDFSYWDGKGDCNSADNSLSNPQEFMKQQIAYQLRNAVQNPNTFYPIYQLKQTESNLKQTIHSLIEQMQMDGSPQLRQQYEATMKQLQAISKQINQLNNKANLPQHNKQFNNNGTFHSGDRSDPAMMKWSGNNMESNPPQQYSRFLSQIDSQKAPFNAYDSQQSAKQFYGRSLSNQVGSTQWNSLDLPNLSSHSDPYSNKGNLLSGMDALNAAAMPSFSPYSAEESLAMPGGGNAVPVNVTEFVPGKPWQGTSVLSIDDPALTPGSARGLLPVNNDRLEKLIKSDASVSKAWADNNGSIDSPFNQNGFTNARNWPMNFNPIGGSMDSNTSLSVYLIVQNLDGNSAEFVKITCQGTGSMTSFHPNPKSAWVLVSFVSRNEAARARQNLQSYGFQVDHLLEHEVAQYTKEFSSRPF